MSRSYVTAFIAGDIGGTNARFALVARTESGFEIRSWHTHESQKMHDITDALYPSLDAFRKEAPGVEPEACWISAAGPVENNVCQLSNVHWSIDGNRVGRLIDLPTTVINDFAAISYGTALLDPEDPEQLVPIPHTGGGTPPATGNVAAVVGAGTGLGVGFLVHEAYRPRAFPSEAGHVDFAPFDEETEKLRNFVAERIGDTPGNELFVSGQGIANTFRFVHERGDPHSYGAAERDEALLEWIANAPDNEIPSLVSRYAASDATCAHVMRLFVRMYGKYAGNIALHVLPRGGVYLAGGIVGKNLPWFLDEPTFMEAFEDNYKTSVQPVLETFPVYVVTEPAVSLYGAAHAAWLETRESINTA